MNYNLVIQPQFKRRKFLLAYRDLCFVGRAYAYHYLSIEVWFCMIYGIYTDNDLAIGTEKAFRIQLLH